MRPSAMAHGITACVSASGMTCNLRNNKNGKCQPGLLGECGQRGSGSARAYQHVARPDRHHIRQTHRGASIPRRAVNIGRRHGVAPAERREERLSRPFELRAVAALHLFTTRWLKPRISTRQRRALCVSGHGMVSRRRQRWWPASNLFQVILPAAPGTSNEGGSSPLLVLAPPFLGPGFWLGARWNRLGETVETRKKRGKTGKKWARYGLRSVNQGS